MCAQGLAALRGLPFLSSLYLWTEDELLIGDLQSAFLLLDDIRREFEHLSAAVPNVVTSPVKKCGTPPPGLNEQLLHNLVIWLRSLGLWISADELWSGEATNPLLSNGVVLCKVVAHLGGCAAVLRDTLLNGAPLDDANVNFVPEPKTREDRRGNITAALNRLRANEVGW